MLLWIELGVVAAITAMFVAFAVFFLKPEHVDNEPTRVRIGAAIQGLIIGLLVGFVLLPLRLAFFIPASELGVGEAPAPNGWASLSILPSLILLIIVRRGLLARAPLIGVHLRAYRKASLRLQIAHAQRVLTRLKAIDADESQAGDRSGS